MMNPTTKTRWLAAAVAIGFIAVTGACGGDDSASNNDGEAATTVAGGAAKATSNVTVKDFKFDPGIATVKAGEVVTWTNKDAFNHSIFDKAGTFKGPDFGATSTFTHTYDKAGSYPYFCGVHNSMTGTITVT